MAKRRTPLPPATPGTVGLLLRAARERAEMALPQAASEVGVSIGHLSFVERGLRPPSLELLRQCAWKYRVPFGDLLAATGTIPLELRRWIERTAVLRLIVDLYLEGLDDVQLTEAVDMLRLSLRDHRKGAGISRTTAERMVRG